MNLLIVLCPCLPLRQTLAIKSFHNLPEADIVGHRPMLWAARLLSCVCLLCSALAFAKTLHAKSVWREVAPVQFPSQLTRVVARWQDDDEDEASLLPISAMENSALTSWCSLSEQSLHKMVYGWIHATRSHASGMWDAERVWR